MNNYTTTNIGQWLQVVLVVYSDIKALPIEHARLVGMATPSPRVPIWMRSVIKRQPMWDRIERAADTIWNHPFTNSLLLCSPYIVAVWLWFKPPLPGIAAVLLGAIAAIMTFREM